VDDTFDGTVHKRWVSTILGNTIHLHNPGVVVTNSGQPKACTSWKDFTLAPDVWFGNVQGVVRNAFWVRRFYTLCIIHLI
jgi:hypothetical protein